MFSEEHLASLTPLTRSKPQPSTPTNKQSAQPGYRDRASSPNIRAPARSRTIGASTNSRTISLNNSNLGNTQLPKTYMSSPKQITKTSTSHSITSELKQ
eukprot:Pgem_evm1s3702